jgi:hypothetical protein
VDLHIRFKINSPKVIHENFDDEVVIVNLDTGNYYSFDKAAAGIWALIESNASVSEVIQHAVETCQGDRPDIEKALCSFIKRLQEEQLIIPLDAQAGAVAKPAGAQVSARSNTEKPVFKAPGMQKFTDMQDLLLLDPIHEVDEKGWPFTKEDLPL